MSDGNESDSSIGTDELNELNNKLDEQLKKETPVVENDLPPPKEEQKQQKEIKKKRVMTQAQKDGLARGREKALENRKKKQATKPIPIPQSEHVPEPAPDLAYSPPEKKKKGRPAKSLEEKLAKQVITKEKVIYVIQDENGNLIKKDPNKISAKEMKKILVEEDAQKKELELGKKLGRLKNGSAKIPKPRTQKQIDHMKNLIEKNQERRGKKSVENKAQTKEIVKEALKEVVSEPARPPPKPQKSVEQQYNDFFS